MMAEQVAGAGRHSVGIQGLRNPPKTAAIQCGRAGAVENAITITPAQSREASVKLIVHQPCGQHNNGVGAQKMIESVADDLGGCRLGYVEMGDLTGGVNTGVGTTGTKNRNLFAAKGQQRSLQGSLDGRAVVLALPTDEGCTVIFQEQAIARHRRT